MRKTLITTTAAALTSLGVAAYAQQQDRDQQRDQQQGATTDPQQQLNQVKQAQLREFMAQGDRQVQVREAAVWALSDLPPELMHRAMERLSQKPEDAVTSVLQAANILELQSAIAAGQSSERLRNTARELNDIAFQIHFKQLLTQDDLRQPFARAAIAAATYYQEAAQEGVKRNDEERTGYSLRNASRYLSLAHTFAQKEPTAQVSLAAYNADTLGEQIVRNSRPTSYDVTGPVRLSARGQQEQRDQDQQEDRRDQDARPDQQQQQQRGGGGEAAAIPQQTEQVVRDLQQAITQASEAIPAARATPPAQQDRQRPGRETRENRQRGSR